MWMKRTLLTTVLVLAMGAAGLPSAEAYCSGSGTHGKTWTRALAGNCSMAQARIDRYVGGSTGVQMRYGDSGSNSYVSATNGTHSGNAFRIHTGFGWTSWQMLR